ncbi:MAG: hypothetical protein QXY87_04700 [Saccharolobus sp.]|uniref:Uncharacterized protein n=3 Tax=Saccharolobus shibatae TaxID=2286 RepID=A0A8F5BWZ2_9CREN|nr:hypothetical protein [Saccharolobus shibatae]MCH4815091.1 hypothetical protein [Saccharolobus shibatae]QXJ29643.1 Uncharacterized protein J5U23_02516 [Saccharolobus shibatae B12]QXJ32873.1 Uncharacterized protein J5U21_02528 [Saccharolobus shibatae]QXJ36004.1 Uncharacterized protein J5U22_02555 [Saccharolobus shibatae]
MSQPTIKVEFEGKAKIGEMMGNFKAIQLKPEDFSSPLALQMALSRIYSELMNMMNQRQELHYVADVKFTDSMGNPVSVGVDFGDKIPPLSKKEVKVKITIEFYDEE